MVWLIQALAALSLPHAYAQSVFVSQVRRFLNLLFFPTKTNSHCTSYTVIFLRSAHTYFLFFIAEKNKHRYAFFYMHTNSHLLHFILSIFPLLLVRKTAL